MHKEAIEQHLRNRLGEMFGIKYDLRPRTILEELRQVHSADVVLPTIDGGELEVRCVIKPNEAQAALLDRLGIDLPRRLAIPKALEGVAV